MMSSVMPSLKYCCAGSPLMLVNGSTAIDGLAGAGELHEHAIAHDLDDTAMMLGHQRLQDFAAPLLQGGERSCLVLLDEPAVADHVRGQNSGQAALHFGLLSRNKRKGCEILKPGRSDCESSGVRGASRTGPLIKHIRLRLHQPVVDRLE